MVMTHVTRSTRSATLWLTSTLFVVAAATWPPGLAQQPQTAAPAKAASDGTEMTVVGCLVRLDTSAWRPGTSDQIPAGHRGQLSSAGYALKDAAESTGAAPETGPIDTRSDREFGIAKGSVSVERFAGHQVVITGRPMTTASNGEVPAAENQPPGHDLMIDVTAIRSISDECPPRG